MKLRVRGGWSWLIFLLPITVWAVIIYVAVKFFESVK